MIGCLVWLCVYIDDLYAVSLSWGGSPWATYQSSVGSILVSTTRPIIRTLSVICRVG